MLVVRHANHLATNLLTTQSLNVTQNSTDYLSSGPPDNVTLCLNTVVTASPVYSAITPVPPGVPQYAGGAVWPQCTGGVLTNAMTCTSNVSGPGAGLSSVTLASPPVSFNTTSLAVDATNHVYAATENGSNVFLKKYNTSVVPFIEVWSFTATFTVLAGVHQYSFAPVLGSNNSVYMITSTGLYSINASTGVLNWLNSFRGWNIFCRTNLMVDGRGFVCGAAGDQLFCCSPSGQTVWLTSMPTSITGLSLDDDTGVLYATGVHATSGLNATGGNFFLVDARTGTQLQTVGQYFPLSFTNEARRSVVLPMVGRNYVYVCTKMCLYAFSKAGALAWSVKLYHEMNSMVYNPRLNIVYVTNVTDNSGALSQRRVISGLNGTTGLTLYNSTVLTAGDKLTVQPIIDMNDNVYVFEAPNTLRVFNAQLSLLATINQALTLGVSPPLALDKNGKLLIATSGGIYISN